MSDDIGVLISQLDTITTSVGNWFAGGLARLPNRPESWGFAGTPTRVALDMFRLALKATPAKSPTLLECGSGFGFVAALGRELGFSVTGLEVVPEYIEVSRRLFPSVRIVEADVLRFDQFGLYDVVFYNGPFVDDTTQARFERKIEENLRLGGIILANRKVDHAWRTSGDFELLWTDGQLRWVIQKHHRVQADSITP